MSLDRLVPPQGHKKRTFLDQTQAYVSDLITGVHTAPTIDYLALGLWALHYDYDRIFLWLQLEGEMQLRTYGEGWSLVRGEIRVHGRRVATLARSKAHGDYGRKIALHFSGLWWRPAPPPGVSIDDDSGKWGLGLDAPAAWRLVQCLREAMAVVGPIERWRPDWVTFVSVDRVDYVKEVHVKRGVTPAAWRSPVITHPSRWSRSEYIDSATGITQYLGPAKSALKARHTTELVRIYQDAPTPAQVAGEGWPTVRIEFETYRLRHVSGKVKHTPETARARFADLLTWYAGEDHAPEAVPLLTFETTIGPHSPPEELTSRRWVGGTGVKVRRLARQGITCATRAIAMMAAASSLVLTDPAAACDRGAPLDEPQVTGPESYPCARDVLEADPISNDDLCALESAIADYRRLVHPESKGYQDLARDGAITRARARDASKVHAVAYREALTEARERVGDSREAAVLANAETRETREASEAAAASALEAERGLDLVSEVLASHPQWLDELRDRTPDPDALPNDLPEHRRSLERVEQIGGRWESRGEEWLQVEPYMAARTVWIDPSTGVVAYNTALPARGEQLRSYYESESLQRLTDILHHVMHRAWRATDGYQHRTDRPVWQDYVHTELERHPEIANLTWAHMWPMIYEIYQVSIRRGESYFESVSVPEEVSKRHLVAAALSKKLHND